VEGGRKGGRDVYIKRKERRERGQEVVERRISLEANA